MVSKRPVLLLVRTIFLFLFALLYGCTAFVEYKPLLLPFSILIDGNGDITINGEASWVTPLGEFSVGSNIPFDENDEGLLLVVRDMNALKGGRETIYRIESNEGYEAIVNGKIYVSQKKVIVDVTHGTIQEIKFTHKTHDSTIHLLTAIIVDKHIPPPLFKAKILNYACTLPLVVILTLTSYYLIIIFQTLSTSTNNIIGNFFLVPGLLLSFSFNWLLLFIIQWLIISGTPGTWGQRVFLLGSGGIILAIANKLIRRDCSGIGGIVLIWSNTIFFILIWMYVT